MSDCKSFDPTKLSMGYAGSAARVTAHQDRVILSVDAGPIGLYLHLSFEEADALADTIRAAAAHSRAMLVLDSVEPSREVERVS